VPVSLVEKNDVAKLMSKIMSNVAVSSLKQL
jgi:hypothetical protein